MDFINEYDPYRGTDVAHHIDGIRKSILRLADEELKELTTIIKSLDGPHPDQSHSSGSFYLTNNLSSYNLSILRWA